MGSVVFKVVGILVGTVKALMVTGLFVGVLSSLQVRAFHNKRVGLTRMLKINQQLVGQKR